MLTMTTYDVDVVIIQCRAGAGAVADADGGTDDRNCVQVSRMRSKEGEMKRSGNVAIVRGFLPWIAFWSLDGAGWPTAAPIVAVGLAGGTAVWKARAGRMTAM